MTAIDRNIHTSPRAVKSRIGMMDGANAGRHLAADIPVTTLNNGWMALGKCRDMDPVLFFPLDGAGVRAAQQICAVCPMKIPCLEYALDHRMDHGVWGGTSERERRRMLRQRSYRTNSRSQKPSFIIPVESSEGARLRRTT